jgi:hypothetical protein
MAHDPAYQPQPDPSKNARRTPAEKGEASSLAPDELRDDETMDDDKAARALDKIEEVRRKLEPRG